MNSYREIFSRDFRASYEKGRTKYRPMDEARYDVKIEGRTAPEGASNLQMIGSQAASPSQEVQADELGSPE